MRILGMAHFQKVCKEKFAEWFNKSVYVNVGPNDIRFIDASDVFVVWSCKTLQNYKCLVATAASNDGIYAEYTYNGNKGELYEDVYKKLSNSCIKEA